jgi:hypothetical protein
MSRSACTTSFEREAPLDRQFLSHRGVGRCGSVFGRKPSLNIAAAPPDPMTVEMKLPWESADQRQCSKNPSVASRQPGDIVRSEQLIPRRQTLIHPPRDRNAGSRRDRRTCRT